MLYQTGSGVTQDTDEAIEWYERSAELGDSDGYVNIGTIYFNGQVADKDNKKAKTYWQKAAAMGNQIALNNLKLVPN